MFRFWLVLAAFLLSGCATTIGAVYETPVRPDEPRDFLIALDGTGSNQLSRTNVSRLYELVDNANIGNRRATYYGEGVGTDGRIIGAATGWGIGNDVREAYGFLVDHWQEGDRIFLTGFSRGAYTARILGGLIAIAGVPDLSKKSAAERRRLIARIYDAYKTNRRSDEDLPEQNVRRLKAITKILGGRPRGAGGGVTIEAMALWDTVEALGLPDRTDDPLEDLDHYFLTTCNVKAAFHALALDDNRAYSFTPIFINTPRMREACPNWHPRVEEIWFAGAHADVGGSYSPGGRIDGYLSGVSLNWMLDRLRAYGLFDPSVRAFADADGPIHDAKAYSSAYRLLFRRFRDPLSYAAKVGEVNGGKPFVHWSAVSRLARLKQLDARFDQCGTRSIKPRLLCSEDLTEVGFLGELLKPPGGRAACVVGDGAGFALLEHQTCISVVAEREEISKPAWGTPWRMAE